MEPYRIFVSSPGDVGKERHLAEQVIGRLTAEFQNRGKVEPYFWEYEPMESTRDYQDNIPLTSEFDLVICILWKRLGSALHIKHERPGGGSWRSGTEFELVTAKLAKERRGLPELFIFKNDTKATFEDDDDTDDRDLDEKIAQRRAVKHFLREWCQEEQNGHKVCTAALNRYTELGQFERTLEKLLRQKLQERFGSKRLDGSLAQRPVATWTEGSPFRGLEAFEFEHAPVFFGRTRAIGDVLDRLRLQAEKGRPFVLLMGASGSGKSSLAMAGVLPLLVKPGSIEGIGLWRRVIFRPGRKSVDGDLFDRFAAECLRKQRDGEGLSELAGDGTTERELAGELRSNPAGAALLFRSALNHAAAVHREREAERIRTRIRESKKTGRNADADRYDRQLADLTRREARLALLIDQAEELFTSEDLSRQPELRQKFATAIAALVGCGKVFVLMTLRTDFYARLQELPALIHLKEGEGLYDLVLPNPAEIAQMIRQPAIAAGLAFETDEESKQDLDEVLADEVKAEPRLLPLLEFALDELYKQQTEQGVLTFAAFSEQLDGSIVRALARRADATLERLAHDWEREAFRSVMRRLATAAESDSAPGAALGPGATMPTFQRLRVSYHQLTGYPLGASALVDAFVKARLLVIEGGDRDEPEVTVAHEALFEHWDKLKEMLISERNDLILPRARVTASCQRWLAAGKALDYLLPAGKQLAEAEHLLSHYGEELSQDVNSYIIESMAAARAGLERERRRNRIVVAIVSAFAVAAAGFGGVSFWQYQRAEEARRQAELRKKQAETSTELAKRARDGAEQLVQFMTFDLQERLKPIGRLGILDAVIDKIQEYYKAFPAQDEAVDVLRRRAAVLIKQGDVLKAQGKLDQALAAFQESLEIRQKLVRQDQTNSGWQQDLAVSLNSVGNVLEVQGKLDQALAVYQKSNGIVEKLVQQDQTDSGWKRDLAESLNNVASVLEAQGKLDQALGAYQQSYDIVIKLVQQNQADSDWQEDLAASLVNIGQVLWEQGKLDEALAAFRQSRDIREQLAKQDSANSGRQRNLAVSLNQVGQVLEYQGGKLDQALTAYQQSHEILQKLALQDVTNSRWQRDLAASANNVGEVLEAQGKLDQALVAYQQSREISQKLVQQDPTDSGWQRDLTVILINIGNVLEAQGKLDQALAAFQQSREIRQELVVRDKTNSGWQADLALAYLKLGETLQKKSDSTDAHVALINAKEILTRLQAEHRLSADAQNYLIETERHLAEVAKARVD